MDCISLIEKVAHHDGTAVKMLSGHSSVLKMRVCGAAALLDGKKKNEYN